MSVVVTKPIKKVRVNVQARIHHQITTNAPARCHVRDEVCAARTCVMPRSNRQKKKHLHFKTSFARSGSLLRMPQQAQITRTLSETRCSRKDNKSSQEKKTLISSDKYLSIRRVVDRWQTRHPSKSSRPKWPTRWYVKRPPTEHLRFMCHRNKFQTPPPLRCSIPPCHPLQTLEATP